MRGLKKWRGRSCASFHSHGKWVSFDVGMEPSKRIPQKILRLLPQVDLLFASSEEAAALTGQSNVRKSFLQFQRAGAKEIVMKLGKRGCLISDGGILREIPSFAVRAVDSTGAGDAFTAAFCRLACGGGQRSKQRLLPTPLEQPQHAVSEQERRCRTSRELFACCASGAREELGRKYDCKSCPAYKRRTVF